MVLTVLSFASRLTWNDGVGNNDFTQLVGYSHMNWDCLILACHDKWFLFLAPNVIMFLINSKCGDADSGARLRQPILNRHICFITVLKKKCSPNSEQRWQIFQQQRVKWGPGGKLWRDITKHCVLDGMKSIKSQAALRKTQILSLVH